MDNILGNAGLGKLNDKDKAELQQFIKTENQKAHIQANVHSLANVCFPKCITGTIKSGELDRTEASCMANCVERFLDIGELTLEHLRNTRHG